MRIKELITENELSAWCLNEFSQLILNKIHGDQ